VIWEDAPTEVGHFSRARDVDDGGFGLGDTSA
jgi:hypothetical protein